MSVIIVTGGTFGLGQSITVDLAQRGHQVVAFGLAQPQVSSTAQGLDSLRAELDKAGVKANVLEADVSSAADVQRVIEHTLSEYGAIHGLVNNAAIGPLGTVLTTDEATFEKILDVNVKGTYLMSRAVLPHMIRASGGSIVNFGRRLRQGQHGGL
jgi:NAD(P)-dependent dehydrogenase (short-subunit alcohol dehydrogenase family)